VRSALEPFGCEISGLKSGELNFSIKYDPAKADLTKMMAALKDKGEPVTKTD